MQVIETPTFISQCSTNFEQRIETSIQNRIDALTFAQQSHLLALKQAYICSLATQKINASDIKIADNEDNKYANLCVIAIKDNAHDIFSYLKVTFDQYELFSADELLSIFTYNYTFSKI